MKSLIEIGEDREKVGEGGELLKEKNQIFKIEREV